MSQLKGNGDNKPFAYFESGKMAGDALFARGGRKACEKDLLLSSLLVPPLAIVLVPVAELTRKRGIMEDRSFLGFFNKMEFNNGKGHGIECSASDGRFHHLLRDKMWPRHVADVNHSKFDL